MNVIRFPGGLAACQIGAVEVAVVVRGVLHEVGDQNEQGEYDGNNGGQLGQLLVPGGCFGFAEEGFRAAGNGTGQVVILTVLHQNGNDQKDCGNDQNNANGDLHSQSSDFSVPGTSPSRSINSLSIIAYGGENCNRIFKNCVRKIPLYKDFTIRTQSFPANPFPHRATRAFIKFFRRKCYNLSADVLTNPRIYDTM